MYIYEGHMGSLYTSDEELSYADTYCETCGGSDWCLGYAATREEAWNLLKDDTDTFDESICEYCLHDGDYDYCDNECDDYINRSGGWDYNYVKEFIEANWDE